MCYRTDQTADFVGFARVLGRLGERSGSLVPGSGTGDLKGIAGEGEMLAPLGGEPRVSLNYRFD